MKKLFIIISLIISVLVSYFFLSKKEAKFNYESKYIVNAPNGLIIRATPSIDANKVGKLNFNDTLLIKSKSIRNKDIILDKNYKIAGHWIEIERGYIFDGFLKEIKYEGKKQTELKVFGSVKSVLTYNITGNKTHENKTKYVFDKKGNLIERYDSNNNKLVLNYRKEYNEDNNLVQENKYINGKAYYNKTYVYNKNGQKIESLVFKKGKARDKSIVTYNKKGDISKIEEYNYHKMKSQKTFYTYDNRNNLVTINEYNYSGEKSWETSNTYDKENRILKKVICSFDRDEKKLYQEYIYEYYENYKEIFYTKYDLNNKIEFKKNTTQYSLDKKNEKVLLPSKDTDDFYLGSYEYNDMLENTKTYLDYSTLGLISKIVYEYDYKGNWLKKNRYNIENNEIKSTETYSYIFDKRNNWINRKEYEKGILIREYVKDICYH